MAVLLLWLFVSSTQAFHFGVSQALPRAVHATVARCPPAVQVTSAGSDDSESSPGNNQLMGRSVVLALSYTTISAAWYLCGMTLFLCGTSPNGGASAHGPVRRVATRLSVAWVTTFAASQVTTPWRAAGAIALSPFLSRVLGVIMRRLPGVSRDASAGARTMLLPAVAYSVLLAVAFGAGVAVLGAREMAFASALTR